MKLLHVIRETRLTLWLLLVWLLLVAARLVYFYEIATTLHFVSFVVDLVLILAGMALSVLSLYALLGNGSVRWPAHAVIGGFSAIVIWLAWGMFGVQSVGAHSWLWRYETTCKEILKSVPDRIGSEDRYVHGEYKSVRYIVDSGTPQIIGFPFKYGIDGWEGMVYDPAGDIIRYNDLTGWDDPRLKDAQFFWGGLPHAEHITGNWYYCRFDLG